MLSIKNITDSGAAVSYFEKDDYYAGKEDGPSSEGVWWGKGAERMGLQGPVDREQFRALLEGHLPDGTELGTVRERGGEKVHTPGWDLTFSAPKSVSILAEVGGDERLLQAHDEAVRETLAWMQDNITGYRKRDWLGIRHQEGDNLAVALFQHHTSRSKDPQLHTHAVVANAVAKRLLRVSPSTTSSALSVLTSLFCSSPSFRACVSSSAAASIPAKLVLILQVGADSSSKRNATRLLRWIAHETKTNRPISSEKTI